MTGEWEDDDQAEDAEARFRGAVSQRKGQLRVEQAARAELAAEGMAAAPAMAAGTDFLAEPDEETAYRIDGLWPAGGNVMCAAQAKAGKTTLTANLLRSLCDGDPFLGRFRVEPPGGRIFLIDAEMTRQQARSWIRAQGIRKADRFCYQPLRGAASSFAITVPAIRRKWAARIAAAQASVIIIDPLGPVLGALGLDENSGTDVGGFLDGALAELVAESGAEEAILLHHLGHGAERSRGTSRLRGWPDVEWFLVRDDKPGSPRYFSAYGRDVDLPESQLDYDPAGRALTIAGGSRAGAKTQAALSDLIKVITAQPGIGTRAIEDTLTGGKYAHARDAARAAVSRALAEGLILCRPGPNRSKLHYPANPPAQMVMDPDPGQGASLTGLPPGAAAAATESLRPACARQPGHEACAAALTGSCLQAPHASPHEAA